MNFTLTERAADYAENIQERLVSLIAEITAIPAPSGREEKRAAFIKKWLEKRGARGVFIDSANNVIFPMGSIEKECNAYIAHIDTVFPDMDPIPVKIENGKMHAPGVGDDTANVAELMLWIEYILNNRLRPANGGVLFVFDACEEGLGDLRGSKNLMKNYGGSIKQLVSFDGTMANVVNMAVGSVRWKVAVEAEGGHSYDMFGNANAIARMSEIICDLYTQKVPNNRFKTTYNVGTIAGGTSINTIAQRAEILYEYRSDHKGNLDEMDTSFHSIIGKYTAKGYKVTLERVGMRPCMGDVDSEAQHRLEQAVEELIIRETGKAPNFVSGSTDCNVSFANGIPSVCFGGCTGYGAHTREEWLEIVSLTTGMRCVGSVLLKDFE